MNREKAEKLLAALIFDDLDASSKAELTAYLETDDELRERLADMRMAMKVASDALQHGPEPVLDEKRLKHLSRLAKRSNKRPPVFTIRYMAAAAAVVAVIILPAFLLFTPSLHKAKMRVRSNQDLKPVIDLSGGGFAMLESHNDETEFIGGTSTKVTLASKPVPLLPTEETSESGSHYFAKAKPIKGGGSDEYGDNITVERYGGGNGGGMMGIRESTHGAVTDSGDPGSVNIGFGTDYGVNVGNGINSDAFVIHNEPEIVTNYAESRNNTDAGFMIDGRLTTGRPNDGINAATGGVLARGEELSLHLDSLGSTGVDGKVPVRQTGPEPAPGNWGISAASDSKPRIQAKLKAEVAGEASGSARIQTNGDVITNGDMTIAAYKKLPHLKGSDISNKKLESIKSDKDYDGEAIAVDNSSGVPVLGDNPILGRKFTGLGVAQEAEEDRPVLSADKGSRESELYFQQIKKRRNAQIDPTDAIVAGAVQKAQQLRDDQQYDQAEEVLRRAASTIERNKMLLGEDHYSEYTKQLGNLEQHVEKAQKDAAQKPPMTGQEAAGLTKQIRDTMEAQRDQAVADYTERAFALQKEQRYEEALGQIDQLLAVEPHNQRALILKQTLEHTQEYIKQRDIVKDSESEDLNLLITGAEEKSIPCSKEINFPKNWKDISEKREQFTREGLTAELPHEDISDLPLASHFKSVPVNPWVMTERDALSTFALDVDTASYTLCRRYIGSGYLPPAGAVRMEEFINYFNYQYPQQSDRTFRVHTEAAPSPFAGEGKKLTLLKIGVKARTLGRDQQKPAHLVFVIDASASMGQPERLPLIQQALNMLIDKLSDADRVSMITCANESRLHLEATPVHQRERIRQAINAIQPSGSTNLLAGLQLGYATARRSFDAKQINRVVLCSDGVANVGQTEAEAVLKAVAADRQQGITMTCVGVGYGTYNDAFLESLANKGDGNYVFLDSVRQAQRVFVEQLAATLYTVAKDARIQVSFNPDRVRRYRLIGYESRDIEDKRFRDDTVDAGEVGSGQCSTALYELELTDEGSADQSDGLGTVFVRYRNVDTDQMEEISSDLDNTIVRTRTVEDSPYFYLSAAAAQFAEILRQSEHVQGSNLTDVLIIAEKVSGVLGLDRDVRELAALIRRSEHLPKAQ